MNEYVYLVLRKAACGTKCIGLGFEVILLGLHAHGEGPTISL